MTAAGPLLAFTSVVRHAAVGERSGKVGVIDLESRRVVSHAWVPESEHRAHDPNPRGGVRGARGLAARDGRLVVANSDRLLVFDDRWKLVAELTHPWLGGIHDIDLDPDGIWVACANADLVVKVGWGGEVLDSWSWRSDRRLVEALGFRRVPAFRPDLDYRDPRTLQGGAHNVVHLNGVARAKGAMLLSFGRVLPARELARRRLKAVAGRAAARLGAVRRERASSARVPVSAIEGSAFAVVELPDDRSSAASLLLLERPVAVPNHNVLRRGRDLVYNDSNSDRVVVWDVEARRARLAVAVPGDPAFARGLARLDDDRYVVGSQRPAAVHVVDLEAGRLIETIEVGEDPREAVYGICVVPESFGPPPPALSFELSV